MIKINSKNKNGNNKYIIILISIIINYINNHRVANTLNLTLTLTSGDKKSSIDAIHPIEYTTIPMFIQPRILPIIIAD